MESRFMKLEPKKNNKTFNAYFIIYDNKNGFTL